MADYIVRDIDLAPWGRKEIEIAETEMPGLMATRAEFGADATAGWGPDRGLPAHDDPDRGAHRDVAGAWARTSVGRRATSSRLRITPLRPSR